jgi:hypothetical protein
MVKSVTPVVLLLLAAVLVPGISEAALEPISVPEPATALLLAAGTLGAAGYARLRRRSK